MQTIKTNNKMTMTLTPTTKADRELMERIQYDAEVQERSRSQILKRIAREYYNSRAMGKQS